MTQTQRDIDDSLTIRYCAIIAQGDDKPRYLGFRSGTTDDAAMYLAIQAIHRELGYNW